MNATKDAPLPLPTGDCRRCLLNAEKEEKIELLCSALLCSACGSWLLLLRGCYCKPGAKAGRGRGRGGGGGRRERQNGRKSQVKVRENGGRGP